MRFPFILQQKSCNTLLARIGALGKERINLSAVADMTRLDSDRRHSPRLVGAKLAHQKAYRLRVVDPKVRRYARCRHFLFSFPFKGIAPQTKSNASIAFMPRKVNGVFFGRFPNFTLGCRPFATLCAVLEKLRRLMFSLPLHGFALFNHNQETLFCSDYSGLRPIYAARPHPKTLQPTHV